MVIYCCGNELYMGDAFIEHLCVLTNFTKTPIHCSAQSAHMGTGILPWHLPTGWRVTIDDLSDAPHIILNIAGNLANVITDLTILCDTPRRLLWLAVPQTYGKRKRSML